MEKEKKGMTEEQMRRHEQEFLRVFSPGYMKGLAMGLRAAKELEEAHAQEEKERKLQREQELKQLWRKKLKKQRSKRKKRRSRKFL